MLIISFFLSGEVNNFLFVFIMPKDYSKKFYNSKVWKDIRTSYIYSRFGICERCGKPNSKQVHHKVYITEENINNPDITIDFNNLELLCDICHQKEHKEKYSPCLWGLEFDKEGNLIKNSEI